MGNNMIGMDATEVRTLADNIRNQSNHLTTVVTVVDAIVHQMLGEWHGEIATEFAGWWQQKHRPALLSVQQSITGLAQSADNQAHQQDQTSAAVGGGSGAAGPGSSAGAAVASLGGAAVAAVATATGSAATGPSSPASSSVLSEINATSGQDYQQIFGTPATEAWCGLYAQKVLTGAGLSTPAGSAAAWVPNWVGASSVDGSVHFQSDLPVLTTGGTPQAGDVVVYFNPGLTAAQNPYGYSPGWCHIGVVKSFSGGTITAAQGNFDGTNSSNSQVVVDDGGTRLASVPPALLNLGVPANAEVFSKDGLYAVVLTPSPA